MARCCLIDLLFFLVCLGCCYSKIPPPGAVNRTFVFASYFSSNMALQRAPQRANLWGYAPLFQIGTSVQITISGPARTKTYLAPIRRVETIQDLAVFNVTLDPFPAGGLYTLEAILQYHEPINMDKIVFGDVWVCTGQENMVFPVMDMFGASNYIENGRNYFDLRLIQVKPLVNSTPQMDFMDLVMGWMHPGLGEEEDKHLLGGWAETFSAICFQYGVYLFNTLNIPIGLIHTAINDSTVEAWSSPEALASCGLLETGTVQEKYKDFFHTDSTKVSKKPLGPKNYSAVWNNMLHPLGNMTITGMVWYQGEANTDFNQGLYNCTFPAMVNDIRQKFHHASNGETFLNMTFGYFQIGSVIKPKVPLSYPEIRWRQMNNNISVPQALKNMFMAVTLDLTDNISPFGPSSTRDKNTVAVRLANAALTTHYKHGPMAMSMYPYPTHHYLDIKHKELEIQFSHGQVEIDVKAYDGFEACCMEDYSGCHLNSTVNWIPSPIVKYNTTTVWISWNKCTTSTIAAYRYAWRDTPCNYRQCAIYSDYSGIPLPTYTQPLNKEVLAPQKTSQNFQQNYIHVLEV